MDHNNSNNNHQCIAQKKLDKFIYEYLLSKNMNGDVDIFKREDKVEENLPLIPTLEGSMREWRSTYNCISASLILNDHEGNSESELFANNPYALENENIMLTNPSASGGTSTTIMEPFPERNQHHVHVSSTMMMDPFPLMNQQLTPLEYGNVMFKNPSANGGISRLDKFIYEYMLNKNLNSAANIFKREVNVRENLPMIPTPEGSLREWWSTYNSISASVTLNGHKGNSESELFANNPYALENENIMLTNPSASGGTSTTIMEPFPERNQHHVHVSSTMMMDPFPLMNQQLTPLEYGNVMFKNPSASGGISSHLRHKATVTSRAKDGNNGDRTSSLDNGMPSGSTSWLTYLNTVPLYAGENNTALPTDPQITENVPSSIGIQTNAASGSSMASHRNCSWSYIRENHNNVIPFKEVGSLRPSTRELLCCHFSSDGKFLASAGHEKKIFLCEVDSFNSVSTVEEHDDIVTDIRFTPSSSILATSSFDRTVKIWNASKPAYSVSTLIGHSQPVVSLDFHPTKSNILCSCDTHNEIRLWDYKKSECLSTLKGVTKQVRFQPRVAALLAASAGNVINLIDIETSNITQQLEGHVENVRSLCWDPSGMYIGSVSEESARIWSFKNGAKCIYSLSFAPGNKFESCVFHPAYSMFMVLGCQQLWNPIYNNITMSVIAYEGVVKDLADDPDRELIASAGYDQQIKLWK